jgi:hypothetical protein
MGLLEQEALVASTNGRRNGGSALALSREAGRDGESAEVSGRRQGELPALCAGGRPTPAARRRLGSLRGTAPAQIIGQDEMPWWDAILVVEYPTPAAFIDMVTNEEYVKVHEHRAAALDRGDLIATSIWTMAD